MQTHKDKRALAQQWQVPFLVFSPHQGVSMPRIGLYEPDTESENVILTLYKQIFGLPETVHWWQWIVWVC
jgi:hypothetical protein